MPTKSKSSWDSIKHSISALEYQVYLERYPDGAFAPLARARIGSLENGQVGFVPPVMAVDPKAIELTFWETVRGSDNPEMYRDYLQKYPRGEFVLLAQATLAQLGA